MLWREQRASAALDGSMQAVRVIVDVNVPYKPCSGNIIDLKSVNYMSKNVTFQLLDI